jgi:hypothetical protein
MDAALEGAVEYQKDSAKVDTNAPCYMQAMQVSLASLQLPAGCTRSSVLNSTASSRLIKLVEDLNKDRIIKPDPIIRYPRDRLGRSSGSDLTKPNHVSDHRNTENFSLFRPLLGQPKISSQLPLYLRLSVFG